MQHDHPLQVVTLLPPWGWLLGLGLKKWETRSWATTYRGLIGIHISNGLGKLRTLDNLRALCASTPFATAFREAGYPDPVTNLPYGVIFAVGNIIEVQKTSAIRDTLDERELAFGDYSDGRSAWRFESVHRLAITIKAKGQLGIWSWEPYREVGGLLTPATAKAMEPLKPVNPRKPKSFA